VKQDIPRSCATVSWELCKSGISVIKKTCNKVLINPIIRNRTNYFRHVYHPTRENTY
jgi:hypothetical protein